MSTRKIRVVLAWLGLVVVMGAGTLLAQSGDAPSLEERPEEAKGAPLVTQYLEIVTPEVDATCRALEAMHGVTFSAAVPELGNARTADVAGGGRIGVRAPMAEHETPVVRPYLLVDDINAAIAEAESAGGEVALPRTEIPGQGAFAIYFLGGIQHGLWEN